ncbi:MAG: YraN family protein [bacterium]|nr:YraN family protein [bacterium]
MKSDNRTPKRKLGDVGENIACEFLKKRGFEILDRNYLRKWGELDIVAKKGGMVRFVEVKSVSRENVTHGTNSYRPEDNMHPWKLKRLGRAIQTYLLEKNIESDWQLDVITVQINTTTRHARVELIENIII